MTDRIVSNPQILAGKPCIKGTRISIEMILEWIASGASAADIVEAYPPLELEDVAQAVRYAAQALENDVILTTEG